MISDSTIIMTVVDLITVTAVAVMAVMIMRRREMLNRYRLLHETWWVLSGLVVFAAHYLADLLAMLVFPIFMGRGIAMNWIETLHLEVAWLTSLAGVCLICIGFSKVVLFLLRSNIDLEAEIIDRKRAEEALRKSEERFGAIFKNSPLAIFLMSRDGEYISVNRQFEKWHRVTANDMIGKTAYEIYPGKFADNFAAQDQEVIDSGKGITREVEVDMNDGVRRSVIISKFPLFDAEGKVTEVCTISTDVTEQRKTEKQLRESQKMEAVGQLAGGIAHEFNNMLQVIINTVHFARDNLHEPQLAQEYLGITLKSAERSADLTRQLLAYGRKTPLVPTTTDLNDLTRDLMKMMRPIIGEQIELEFKHADKLCHVKVDPTMIEQSLVNLCVNARDAMPDGGRLIFETRYYNADQQYCDIHGLDQPGDYAMISVSDNGIGMTAEIREHIFEPFFTTKDVGQGTGLGLAMVHGVIQQHDGVIEALSEPSIGSTFNIYLPKSDHKETKKEATPASGNPGGNETILVAEDEEEVLKMLAKILESGGYRVLTAKDGEEAMTVFKANADRIDIVITDLVMPKMRGRQVYEQIRESGSDVPVLFSTGYSLESSDAEYVAGQGLRTIQKPYGPDVLLSKVREVLDER